MVVVLTEFQRNKKLQITDGTLTDETYAALGREMTPEQKRKIIYNDSQQSILSWLLEGRPLNLTPPILLLRKSQVEKSNGNLTDENTDKELAKLLTQNGIVRAASASLRGNLLSDHFRILGEEVYTIHIYGNEDGISATGIYLPKYFNPPKFAGGDTVTALTKKGEVLGIAHVRVSSQSELDANCKSGKVNAAGSKYIGETAGIGGDNACYRHAHLHFFPNNAARSTIKERKANLRDPTKEDSNFLLDVRDLLRK